MQLLDRVKGFNARITDKIQRKQEREERRKKNPQSIDDEIDEYDHYILNNLSASHQEYDSFVLQRKPWSTDWDKEMQMSSSKGWMNPYLMGTTTDLSLAEASQSPNSVSVYTTDSLDENDLEIGDAKQPQHKQKRQKQRKAKLSTINDVVSQPPLVSTNSGPRTHHHGTNRPPLPPTEDRRESNSRHVLTSPELTKTKLQFDPMHGSPVVRSSMTNFDALWEKQTNRTLLPPGAGSPDSVKKAFSPKKSSPRKVEAAPIPRENQATKRPRAKKKRMEDRETSSSLSPCPKPKKKVPVRSRSQSRPPKRREREKVARTNSNRHSEGPPSQSSPKVAPPKKDKWYSPFAITIKSKLERSPCKGKKILLCRSKSQSPPMRKLPFAPKPQDDIEIVFESSPRSKETTVRKSSPQKKDRTDVGTPSPSSANRSRSKSKNPADRKSKTRKHHKQGTIESPRRSRSRSKPRIRRHNTEEDAPKPKRKPRDKKQDNEPKARRSRSKTPRASRPPRPQKSKEKDDDKWFMPIPNSYIYDATETTPTPPETKDRCVDLPLNYDSPEKDAIPPLSFQFREELQNLLDHVGKTHGVTSTTLFDARTSSPRGRPLQKTNLDSTLTSLTGKSVNSAPAAPQTYESIAPNREDSPIGSKSLVEPPKDQKRRKSKEKRRSRSKSKSPRKNSRSSSKKRSTETGKTKQGSSNSKGVIKENRKPKKASADEVTSPKKPWLHLHTCPESPLVPSISEIVKKKDPIKMPSPGILKPRKLDPPGIPSPKTRKKMMASVEFKLEDEIFGESPRRSRRSTADKPKRPRITLEDLPHTIDTESLTSMSTITLKLPKTSKHNVDSKDTLPSILPLEIVPPEASNDCGKVDLIPNHGEERSKPQRTDLIIQDEVSVREKRKGRRREDRFADCHNSIISVSTASTMNTNQSRSLQSLLNLSLESISMKSLEPVPKRSPQSTVCSTTFNGSTCSNMSRSQRREAQRSKSVQRYSASSLSSSVHPNPFAKPLQ